MDLSQLYGKEIITYGGKKLGRVSDVIIDTESGRVVKLCLRRITDNKTAVEILKKQTIDYEDVLEVGDVVVVQREPAALSESSRSK